MKKRAIALCLALVMILSLFPLQVIAIEEKAETENENLLLSAQVEENVLSLGENTVLPYTEYTFTANQVGVYKFSASDQWVWVEENFGSHYSADATLMFFLQIGESKKFCAPADSEITITVSAESLQEKDGSFRGNCGESASWVIDSEHNMTVSGSGSIWSYDIVKGMNHNPVETPWNLIGFKTLTISEGITSIGTWAFRNCEGLKDLFLPASLSALAFEAIIFSDSRPRLYYGGSEENWNTLMDEYSDACPCLTWVSHYCNFTSICDHIWSEWSVYSNPTCKDQGGKECFCSICGGVETEYIPALGGEHSWNVGVTTKAPSCKATGTELFTCSRCGMAREEIVAPLNSTALDISYTELGPSASVLRHECELSYLGADYLLILPEYFYYCGDESNTIDFFDKSSNCIFTLTNRNFWETREILIPGDYVHIVSNEAEFTPKAVYAVSEHQYDISGVCIECGKKNLNVEITAESFPDNNFRNYVLTNFDTDHDGYLSESEALAVLEVRVNSWDNWGTVSDLTGISYFENLQYLYCENQPISSLDLGDLSELESLYCYGCDLSQLDLRKNSKLSSVDCSNNKIAALLLPSTCAVTSLDCSSNALKEVDFNSAKNLYNLNISNNQFSKVNLESCTELRYFYFSQNNIYKLLFPNDCTISNYYGAVSAVVFLQVKEEKNGLYYLDLSEIVGENYLSRISSVSGGYYDSAAGAVILGSNAKSVS